MGGEFDKKPGGSSLVDLTVGGREDGHGPGKHTLTESQGARSAPVMRKADAGAAAGGGDAATAGPADAHAAQSSVKRLTILPQKHLPDGGIVSDPSGAAAAQPKAGVAQPGAAAQGHGGGRQGAVQGRGDVGGGTATVHAAAAHGTAGSGGSLPHLDKIQALFGHHDVSGVQAHTDANAAAGSRAMGAEAYATGSHVAFASSQPSLHTAAHEAAHVVQQRGGVQLKGGVGQVGDSYEQHADAVADRVARGESAVDLLDPYAGGGGGGQQPIQCSAIEGGDRPAGTGHEGPSASVSGAAPSGTTGGGSTTPATPATPAAKHHYEVELKAWIPHAKVVDPEEPARLSDWLDTASSIARALDTNIGIETTLNYEFHSYYRGDGHAGYAGGYRVLSKASFDFDGTAITGFTQIGTYGASHRDWNYRAWVDVSAGIGPFRKTLYTKNINSGSGTETKTATSATAGAAVSPTTFNLNMASANPFVMTWAPTIDSSLNGMMTPTGNMTLFFNTDLFPSHGVQVSKDGAMIKQQVVNDPSGINPLGPIAAANIGYRLMSQSNFGVITAP